LLPQGLKPQSKRSSYRSAETLRHPKSTAAGEGARATRNQATSVRLNGAAKSRAPSKQPPSKQSLQNNVRIPNGGRRWNPRFKGEGWARGSAQSHNAPTPYSLGIGSTAPRGLRGGRPTWQDRRAEGCESRYNDSFPDERIRVFCSEFVTAARALCGVRSSTEVLRCAPDDNS
jgi:hypothetical protein